MKINKKILVVDDEQVTLDFFDVTLSRLGFDVYKASDGAEALEKIKLYSPDIMLLDIMLPKLTGFEVIQILKKDKEYSEYKNLPVVMFSALDDVESKVMGLEMGVEDYITKPFNFSEVLARIRNIIKQKEIGKQLIKRERRLAILESLNTNLIAFTRHIKRPFEELHENLKNIDAKNIEQFENFKIKFENEYKQTFAMISSIEEEIIAIENKGNKMKEEEFSLEELEKRINRYLNSSAE
ncbi:MAG TPA: response regulator [Spirochaetota bacterium]|nr:response regulator [Spirochaetota bacterium]